MEGKAELTRCKWCNNDLVYQEYHDNEWGVPKYDDKTLFEMLILEGAQAGLSWITILKRRENYRKAFDNFDVNKVAKYSEKDIDRLVNDKGIIRNKLKINSAIKNAKVFIEVQKEFGSFSKYIWSKINDTPIINHYKDATVLPVTSSLAEQISKELKKKGMSFIGPIIIYSYMQSIGMINDHTLDCFLRK
ncbi:DNA-3-methyladenine glycosylase I [Tenacibaculum sp. Mcav3-52]|uniref:DNA-3-methyladenine glycosylase I n=1 Tax=Tenacibaculum sp. Mcav3-52 TaxID=2917762 RepID=UPI001EF2809C|nr:DNA-3-methyladenine glycosylase I [Tenacibaculum sp. Mcav3-52]